MHRIFFEFQEVLKSHSMRTAVFWVVTQRLVLVPYRHFGSTYRFHLRGSGATNSFGFLKREDRTDRLSRNVGRKLLLGA
jgi:hypothetical protein